MSQLRLKFVRKDSKYVVLTEHPDFIHHKDLAERLACRFGKNQFTISLIRNIYIVYLNREAAGKEFVSESSHCLDQSSKQNGQDHAQNADGSESGLADGDIDEDFHQQMLDSKLAEKVVIAARLSGT